MMPTGRIAATTERLAALSERLQQLDTRLRRLEAGEGSSVEDLRTAVGNARRQQSRAAEAEAALDGVRRHLDDVGIARAGGAGRSGRDQDSPSAGSATSAGLPRRAGLYWRAIVEECRRRGWHDWTGAWCQVAGAALPSVRGVAISVMIDGLPTSMATTDVWTHQLEEAQRVLGEGPTPTTHTTGGPVIARLEDAADLTSVVWSRLALSRGAREVWSFPCFIPGLDGVTVTFYRRHDGAADSERAEATVLSGLAERALIADARRAVPGEIGPPDPVDIAIGMLAERLHLSPADAFARIRARAFVTDHGLPEVADAVLTGAFDLG